MRRGIEEARRFVMARYEAETNWVPEPDDWWWPNSRSATPQVYSSDGRYTGLLDINGHKIYRYNDPIGFRER